MGRTPHENFDDVVEHIHRWLRARGFVKRGNRFGVRRGEDWGVIALQKHSLATTRANVEFGVNLGAWFRDFEDAPLESVPADSDCHWRGRVGDEPPESAERWWIIDDETSLVHLLPQITAALERAVLALERGMDEEWLVAQFLARGNVDGLSIRRDQCDRVAQFIATRMAGPTRYALPVTLDDTEQEVLLSARERSLLWEVEASLAGLLGSQEDRAIRLRARARSRDVLHRFFRLGWVEICRPADLPEAYSICEPVASFTELAPLLDDDLNWEWTETAREGSRVICIRSSRLGDALIDAGAIDDAYARIPRGRASQDTRDDR